MWGRIQVLCAPLDLFKNPIENCTKWLLQALALLSVLWSVQFFSKPKFLTKQKDSHTCENESKPLQVSSKNSWCCIALSSPERECHSFFEDVSWIIIFSISCHCCVPEVGKLMGIDWAKSWSQLLGTVWCWSGCHPAWRTQFIIPCQRHLIGHWALLPPVGASECVVKFWNFTAEMVLNAFNIMVLNS